MEKLVRLRGHHLLCLLGFRGLGYSDEFVSNMALVHKRVFIDGCTIEIVTGPDDICVACPRLDNGRCKSDDSSDVKAKDATVIDRLGLTPGSRAASDDVYRLVAGAFQPEDIPKLCERCKWLELGYCAEGLRQRKSKV